MTSPLPPLPPVPPDPSPTPAKPFSNLSMAAANTPCDNIELNTTNPITFAVFFRIPVSFFFVLGAVLEARPRWCREIRSRHSHHSWCKLGTSKTRPTRRKNTCRCGTMAFAHATTTTTLRKHNHQLQFSNIAKNRGSQHFLKFLYAKIKIINRGAENHVTLGRARK